MKGRAMAKVVGAGQRIATALIFGLLAGNAVAAGSNNNSIAHLTYTVAATNDEWTATEINLVPGDVVILREPGTRITVGAFIGKTDADGQKGGEGALQVKVGVGAAKKAGRDFYMVASEAGALKLRVSDTKYEDNEGAYSVGVLHIPAALIPPPRQPNPQH